MQSSSGLGISVWNIDPVTSQGFEGFQEGFEQKLARGPGGPVAANFVSFLSSLLLTSLPKAIHYLEI